MNNVRQAVFKRWFFRERQYFSNDASRAYDISVRSQVNNMVMVIPLVNKRMFILHLGREFNEGICK